ncbi:hypothetical protein [Gimesia algae]|uniref:Uncharacterized protein n=1 Tax=Gimesia algae TaxID=2527971 RepID=A0A517V834_9PLAN|nr:hypothetical protein [Gimesia algae]QDT89167.1 hypothetical protein Pan161_07930 [Gimesia algae]
MLTKEDLPHAGQITTATSQGNYIISIEGNDGSSCFVSVYQIPARALIAVKDPIQNDKLNSKLTMMIQGLNNREHAIEKKSVEYYSENDVNQFYLFAVAQGGNVDESTATCTKRNLHHEQLGFCNKKMFSQVLPV